MVIDAEDAHAGGGELPEMRVGGRLLPGDVRDP
jgi:hypothetical protein